MGKKKIYEYSFLYYLLSKVAFFFLRIYYRKITIIGQENVPKGDIPIIFAPNHKNALMDALLLLRSFPKEQIVFMANSQMFIHNMRFAKFLRFIKMLPVFRMRDGYDKLGNNEGSFIEAIDVLNSEKKLCLMPEGQQIEQRRLLPLVKGMFRIGLHAQEKYGREKGVKIVPVGIDYEDLNYSGRNALIQFGQPVELSEYFDLYTENPALAYNAVRGELYSRIEELMLNVNSTENYETIYLATILELDDYLKKQDLTATDQNKLKAKQEINKRYLKMEKEEPEKFNILKQEMDCLYASGKTDDEIARLVKKIKFSDYIYMIIFSPLFIVGCVFMCIPYFAIKYINNSIQDKGFYSSLSYILGIVFPAVAFILYFLIALFFIPAVWSALTFLIIIPILCIFAFKLKNLYFDTFQRISFQRIYKRK